MRVVCVCVVCALCVNIKDSEATTRAARKKEDKRIEEKNVCSLFDQCIRLAFSSCVWALCVCALCVNIKDSEATTRAARKKQDKRIEVVSFGKTPKGPMQSI